jgi:chromate transporter
VAHGDVPAVAGAFYGIKPAVTAIVVFAAWRLGSRALSNAWLAAIAVLAFAAVALLRMPFPLVIALAGAIGFVGGKLEPAKFSLRAGHGAGTKSFGPALIDDDTAPPAHAVFARGRFVRVLIVSVVLWAGAIAALALALGSDAVLTRMGLFFTQAALLTFGGAYAVLPYVFQGAVEQHQWLSAGQMIDGLALGESTPGPLIMVVAFVGFVGAWNHAALGAHALVLAGAAGAAVATFFTFLPSFCFVLLGGPLIESTHGDLRFTAPLAGISAAVVGVIVNLALFFAWHVLWPAGFAGGFDAVAAAIGALAALLLFAFQVRVIAVLAVCAAIGLAWRLLA